MPSPFNPAPPPSGAPAHRFAIAPMMDWTDRHCRYFHRLMTRHALLYTEMITTGAVLHGDRARLLRFDPAEHPVAVQIGGSDPDAVAASARICADLGYDEINLNVGCPSDRVQSGRFGACLMAEPKLVGDCVAAMKAAVRIPVTVKCRIGIDDQDPEEALDTLAEYVTAAGVDRLIVHARKAWLKGLSPRENRDVPPLDYARVFRLKNSRPGLVVVINGGIGSVEQAVTLVSIDGAASGGNPMDGETMRGPASHAGRFPEAGSAGPAPAFAATVSRVGDTADSPQPPAGTPHADTSLATAQQVDGVMIGRAAYQEPWRLLAVDPVFFGAAAPVLSPAQAVEALIPYVERETAAGERANAVLRHAIGLFHRMPGARAYRRHLATEAVKPGAGGQVLRDALALIARRDAPPDSGIAA